MCRCIDSRAICVMGSFVALVGGVCLAVFSVMTTQPYIFAKDFNEVTCTSNGYISCEYIINILKWIIHNLHSNAITDNYWNKNSCASTEETYGRPSSFFQNSLRESRWLTELHTEFGWSRTTQEELIHFQNNRFQNFTILRRIQSTNFRWTKIVCEIHVITVIQPRG